MIEKIHRFQGRGSLRFVYQRGQTIRGPFTSLKYVHNGRRNTYRVAVVVSRKVHKSAVVRNRIRRRVYEIVRRLPLAAMPFDLVITVFSDQVAALEQSELTHTIAGQLEKAGVYRPDERSVAADHVIVEVVEGKESL